MNATRRMLRWLGRMEFLRFGIRRRVVLWFHNPAIPDSTSFEVDFFGLKFPGRFDSFIEWNVFYFGCYAREELMFLRDMLRRTPGAVMLDVGANVGNHTLFASLHAAEVHAFEPAPEVVTRLREKVGSNAIPNVRIHAIGLGASDAELVYFPPGTTNSGAGSFVFDFHVPSIRLPVRHGDRYLDTEGVRRVDVIKIDVEGFEPDVLRGLRETMARFRPVVMFEWRPREDIPHSAESLFPPNYRFFRLSPPAPRLGILERRGYRLERADSAFGDGNFVAMPDEQDAPSAALD